MTLYLTGDVHGNAFDLVQRAKSVGAGAGDEVLVLGDAGLAYGARGNGMPRVNGWMAQLNRAVPWTLVIMRGNHDVRYERDFADKRLGEHCGLGRAVPVEWHGGPAWRFQEIGAIVLPDAGGLYEIGGAKTLVAPGAWSIDGRYRRMNGLPFEREEMLTANELAVLLELAQREQPACILSHTCPESWRGEMGDLMESPGAWTDDSMEEAFQGILGATSSAALWAFGHFHGDRRVGSGVGRLMYHDIASFNDLLERSDLTGSGREYREASSAEEEAHRVAYLVGGEPDTKRGYTAGRLCELLGCTSRDVQRALYGQKLEIDAQTGQRIVYVANVEAVVGQIYGGGFLQAQ